MQLILSGHHIDLTEALRSYVNEKLERLERHFDHLTNVNVVLSAEKKSMKAEASVNVSGAQLFAECHNANMYAAIDALVDKLDRQVIKHKEKLTDHHRAEGRRAME